MSEHHEKIAERLIHRAKRKGARQVEVFLQTGRESSCRVRDGQIEDLTEATSKGVGIRVIVNGRLGFAYTSDFETESLNRFVDRAVELAEAAAPHRLNGLPAREDLKPRHPPLELFDPQIANLPADWKVKASLEMERAGKAVDARIATFESVGAGENVIDILVASSEGLLDGYSGTYAFLYAAPVASDGSQLQTSYWLDYKRFFNELETPEQVGKEAARRAVRMLGARKIKSQKIPVLLDPLMAASFVESVAEAADGDAIFKKSSFFARLSDKRVAAEVVTIADDGLLPKGLGTAPFDGEGVPTRKTPIIERGELKGFLYDSFTARKAKQKTTANATRAYNSLPSIGTHNLYLEAGQTEPQKMIGEVEKGLYVTAMLGRGANIVTGEYSRGANGLWIEHGELTYPVQEVTVAGNMLEMLKRVDAVGTDLQFRGSTGAPTLRFSELTVAGE